MATLTLTLGDNQDARSIPIALEDGDSGATVARILEDARVTAADSKGSVSLSSGGASAAEVVTVMAVLHGLVGRFAILEVGEQKLDPKSLDAPDLRIPKPASVLKYWVFDPTADDVDALARFSRRVILHGTDDIVQDMRTVMVLAKLRVFDGRDRLPDYLPLEQVGTEGAEPLSLSTLRLLGTDLRGRSRARWDGVLVEQQALTQRQERLNKAASWDIEDVMVRLGARLGTDGEHWHCPRPERHNNGDANPSIKLTAPAAMRCYKCDSEEMDSLRLVMDVLGDDPDTSADWILEGGSLQPALAS